MDEAQRFPEAQQTTRDAVLNEWLARHVSGVGFQIIQKFVNVCLKKFLATMSRGEFLDYLQKVFKPMLAVESSLPLFQEALAIPSRYKLS